MYFSRSCPSSCQGKIFIDISEQDDVKDDNFPGRGLLSSPLFTPMVPLVAGVEKAQS
jgi:hypothetical protein